MGAVIFGIKRRYANSFNDVERCFCLVKVHFALTAERDLVRIVMRGLLGKSSFGSAVNF